MNSNDLELGALFTKNNNRDVWKLVSYCMQPTCRLKNLSTGQEESFGIGGFTAQGFHRISSQEKREIIDKIYQVTVH